MKLKDTCKQESGEEDLLQDAIRAGQVLNDIGWMSSKSFWLVTKVLKMK